MSSSSKSSKITVQTGIPLKVQPRGKTRALTVALARARPRARNRGNRGIAKRGYAFRSYNHSTQLPSQLTMCYAESLVDPFEYSGCKLGWGCYAPSKLATAYIRGTSVANADGSWAIAVLPTAKQMVGIWAGGLGVGQNTFADSSDVAAVQANFQAGRPISLGVRIIPSLAMTSAPGFIYGGLLTDTTYNRMAAIPTGELVTLASSLLLGNANIGASCTGRPYEPNCFNFHSGCVDAVGHGVDTAMPFGIPYIVVTGLPVTGIPIAFECVFNFEGLPKQIHSAAPLGQQQQTKENTLSDEWVSYDSMWKYVEGNLPSYARAYENIASIDAKVFGGAMAKKGVRLANDFLRRATGQLRDNFK